jgi:serine/threonine protein kinase/tetratricopeptide (TPR) repeat protein
MRTSEQTGEYSRPGAVPSRHAAAIALETVLPGYEIIEELGRGGMGVVYKARHLRLQRLVALKMILSGAHAGAAGLMRFRVEAEAVARLQHPNIVQIYETGEHEGRPYLSLEFVEGGSLEQQIRDRPLTPRAAAELVETLARTMSVAHQRGIIHRDLKPANVLVVSDQSSVATVVSKPGPAPTPSASNCSLPTVKITDFGLAKRVDDDSTNTQVGTILGTPCYMAPEQAEGKNHEIGPAADIYALGAICYELLVGRPPFKAGNPVDTIRQVIGQDPVPPRQLEPRVPADLETICLKCLEKEPARRYASAADLADDLRRFLDDKPIHARPTPAWERLWKWGKRRPAIVALLGVILAAIVSVVLLVVWHYVSLQDELIQARTDEREAHRREQEALEGQRLSRVEAEGKQLLHDAQLAVAARDWSSARLQLTKALATIGAEPQLQQLRPPAQALLKQVEQELRVEADRRASQVRFDKFAVLRDEAQFLGTLHTGMDLSANLTATSETVKQALAVYGITVSAAGQSATIADVHLTEAQKAEVRADCHQLLLILAETEAQQASEKKDKHLTEALRLLDMALRFGAPSRAYHLRRARYLALLDDKKAATEAEKAAAEAPVVHVLDHFLMADEHYRRGKFDAAIKAFDQVLQGRPGHFWAQYLSALCLLRQNRHAEAKAQLGACLAQHPDFVWLYLFRGYAQTELKVYDGAEFDFQQALKRPLSPPARYVLHVNRGVLRIRQDRLDDAIADLKIAIELRPNDYQAHVNLAQAYRQQKKTDQALAELDRAVQLEPGLPLVYRVRARLHLERGELALALADLEQAIQHDYSNDPRVADDHVERGRLLLREKKYADALAAFDAALRLNTEHSLGQRLRAETLFQLGRYQEVVEAFNRYLVKGKPLESVYRGRGLALAELGRYPSAIEDYTRALELQPTSTVQTYRGWAHLVCDAPKLALVDFQIAIRLDASNADAYSGRGLILASQGKHREAIRDAEEACRRGPPTPRLLYNAARIHALCGNDSHQRAIELIRQALDSLPSHQRAGFWSSYIQKDTALQAIRRHPQFLRLEAEMSQRP